MTTELCGHWEHEGPDHEGIDPVHASVPLAAQQRDREGRARAKFRTVFVAGDSDAALVSRRIESSLRQGNAWQVRTVGSRPVGEAEESLAQSLLAGSV